jgi:hypothetical protein
LTLSDFNATIGPDCREEKMRTITLLLIIISIATFVQPLSAATEYDLKLKTGLNPAVIAIGNQLAAAYTREDNSIKVCSLSISSPGDVETVDSVVLTDTSSQNTALCSGQLLTLGIIDADSYVRLVFLDASKDGKLEYVANKVLTEKSIIGPAIAASGNYVFVAWVIIGEQDNIGLCALSVTSQGKAKIQVQRTLYDLSTALLTPSLEVLNGYLYLSYMDNDQAIHIVPFEIDEKSNGIDLIQKDEHPLNIKAFKPKSGFSCPPVLVASNGTLYLGWVDYSDEMVHIRSYVPVDGSITLQSSEKIFREKVTRLNMFAYQGGIWASWIDDYNAGSRTTFSTYAQKVW